jgi:hypothetical protein
MKQLFYILLALFLCTSAASFIKEAEVPVKTKNYLAYSAHKAMWDQLHLGNYDSIPSVLVQLNNALHQNTQDSKIAAHLGFIYLWKFCERGRKKPDSAIIQNIYLSNHFFKQSLKLNKNDARIYGFQSATELCEGAASENIIQIASGYFKGRAAIKKWPQFNRFALSFIESQLDTSSRLYKQGMKYQWQLIDECSCKELNKKEILESPETVFKELIQELQLSNDPRVTRACWNSWIAPHNFEGFLLNLGDMLVKQGHVKEAKKIYKATKLSPSFHEWVYKKVIDERIKNAEKNIENFNKEMKLVLPRNEPQLFINSPISCVACHQMSPAEFIRFGYQEPGYEIYNTTNMK